MTADEVLELDSNTTLVLLADGRIGQLIGYPFEYREEVLIQVPGEAEARKVLPAQLSMDGGALLEEGAQRPAGVRPAGETLESVLLSMFIAQMTGAGE